MNRILAARVLFCVASIVLLSTMRLSAAQLAIMNYKTHADTPTIPVGDRLYTLGVWIDPVYNRGYHTLSVNIGFHGAAGNPIQSTLHTGFGATNVPDRQGVQDLIDDSFPLSYSQNAFFADSWWYSSSTGQLTSQGLDESIPPTVVTTDPFLGPSGTLWTPTGSGIQGGSASGPDMRFEGVYAGGTPVRPGLYPLVQLLISANVNLIFDADTRISLTPVDGGPAQNFDVGGYQSTLNLHSYLSYVPWTYESGPYDGAIGLEPLPSSPEPATLALIAFGAPSILMAARAKRKRS